MKFRLKADAAFEADDIDAAMALLASHFLGVLSNYPDFENRMHIFFPELVFEGALHVDAEEPACDP